MSVDNWAVCPRCVKQARRDADEHAAAVTHRHKFWPDEERDDE